MKVVIFILSKINKIRTRNISTNYFSISTRSSVNYIPDVIEVMIIKHIKIM
jgi:predicted choloylglycine hydrolase